MEKKFKVKVGGFGLTGLVAERLLRGTVVSGVMHDNVREAVGPAED